MKVIESEPGFWYLLTEGAELIITISCEHSFVAYDFTMKLGPDEIAQYQAHGRSFVGKLAEEVNYSCPIARDSSSAYKNRNIHSMLGEVVDRAVEKWQRKNCV